MHPATISFCARPNFLYSAISRMDCTDSCCAGAMKLQVLTTSTSASSGARREFVARARENAHHHLAIDEVLRASQADESDFRHLSAVLCGARESLNSSTAIVERRDVRPLLTLARPDGLRERRRSRMERSSEDICSTRAG